MSSNIYGYPLLDICGLGNNLCVWARCVNWCNSNNAEIIAPNWNKIRINTIIRKARDSGSYAQLFKNNYYINSYRKYRMLISNKRIDEPPFLNGNNPDKNKIVVFKGMKNGFDSLLTKSEFIRNELIKITKKQYIPFQNDKDKYVGLHIRMGDFSIPPNAELLKRGIANQRLPLDWFLDILKNLRKSLDYNIKAIVFSDGKFKELEQILMMPNVEWSNGKKSITDLLKLSQSKIIIASKSTFSMWGSYLYQAPIIYYPGQKGGRTLLNRDFEIELNYGETLPDRILSCLG